MNVFPLRPARHSPQRAVAELDGSPIDCIFGVSVANWIPGQGQWVAHHGMTAADAKAKHKLYTSKGCKRTSSSTCGSRSVAVWRK